VSVSNQFSKRSSISGGLVWDKRVIQSNEDSGIDTRSATLSYSHSLTRKLAFHVGYGIQELRNGFEGSDKPVRSNMMDVGLGYGDGLTLSLGRHTTLSLSIGASIMKNGDPVSVATTGKSTAFGVDGTATLGRSVGFSDLITTDSANAGIGGPLTSRLQFSAGAGASRGYQVFAESRGALVSYTASTRLSLALFSHLGLYGQASYYRFSIPAGFTNFGFIPGLDRRSVSVGLNTWLPLIKHRGARRDPGGQTTTGQP
jgi:hypothetical protein